MTQHTPYNETIVEQHTQQAEGYARLTRGMIATDRRADLRALLQLTDADEVLDVACGPGSLALDLAPYVARVTGYDITPAMLDQAHTAQARLGLTNVDWVLGDAAGLPFADGTFSVVGSSAAFHHFERPDFVLSEMARVCRSGGRLVVLDVTPDAGKAEAYDRMERLRDPSHGHAHTIAEFVALGRETGLGEARTMTNLTAPMSYAAVLETSFPETCTRDQLLAMMRDDAAGGEDRLGFRAQLQDCAVMVTYPMSMIAWTKP